MHQNCIQIILCCCTLRIVELGIPFNWERAFQIYPQHQQLNLEIEYDVIKTDIKNTFCLVQFAKSRCSGKVI